MAKNVLGSLQWQMKSRADLLENSDLEVEIDEEAQAVNGVQDKVVSYIKKKHSLLGTCYITLW